MPKGTGHAPWNRRPADPAVRARGAPPAARSIDVPKPRRARPNRREVTEIAEPAAQDNRRSRADEILAASDRETKERLESALEEALREDAAQLLSDYPQLRPGTPVRRRIGYKGFQLDLTVPRLRRANGELRVPPRFEELSRDPHKALLLRRYGVTTRNVPAVLEEIYGEPVPGTSRSAVSRDDIGAGEDALATLAKRRFDGQPPIVAVALDGTAVGTRNRKRTVMIVVGVKADATRWLLDTFVAQHEPAKDITPRLRRLVEKGVSPDVYWVADSGRGIRGALRAIGATNIGTCTTHAVGNVTKGLPKAIEEQFRLKIYGALSEDAPKAALQRLDAVEAELRKLGHIKQARSLKRHKKGMVKTQELGLTGELRTQLRSTNALVEGQNHTVKVQLRDVSNWQDKDDTMRIRWVAKRALELERGSWRRLADPKGLVALGRRLGLGHNWETIAARLPPSLEVKQVATPLAEMKDLGTPGARWLADRPGATWFGAPEALAKLGVGAGDAVGPDELARAMRGEHAVSGEPVRQRSEVTVVVRGRGGRQKKQTVPGVLNLEWQLTASPAFMTRWRAADEVRRAELEGDFKEAATAAIERATRSTQRGHGFASTMALHLPPPGASGTEDVLWMSGLSVGVSRSSKPELRSPARAESLSAVSREGEDAAKAVLDRAFARPGPAPDMSAHPPEEPSPAVLAGVELRALEKAPRMVAAAEGLEAIAAGEAAARAELDRACGEASGWWNANRPAAARQVAAARLRDPGGAKRDPWFPISPGRRLLLGEERALDLRTDAARLVGRASANPDFAAELTGFDGDPLAELGPAVATVEALAEAGAARRELDRRELFERVKSMPRGERPPPEVRVRDARGTPAKRPVERYRGALGPHEIALGRYSAALGPQVAELHPEQLEGLFSELGEPWKSLDQDAGARHVRLSRRRERELANLLAAEYRAGRAEETSALAEAKGDAGRAFDASDGQHEAEAMRVRGELARIDQSIDDARRQGKGPEPERFVGQHPEAAVYDAAFAEAQQRELSRTRAAADVGVDVGL